MNTRILSTAPRWRTGWRFAWISWGEWNWISFTNRLRLRDSIQMFQVCWSGGHISHWLAGAVVPVSLEEILKIKLLWGRWCHPWSNALKWSQFKLGSSGGSWIDHTIYVIWVPRRSHIVPHMTSLGIVGGLILLILLDEMCKQNWRQIMTNHWCFNDLLVWEVGMIVQSICWCACASDSHLSN